MGSRGFTVVAFTHMNMTRLFVVLLPLLVAVIAKPWVPGGEPDLEGIVLETGLGKNVDAPTAPHADFARVYTLHGFPMKCGLGFKFEGTCIPDPDYVAEEEAAASEAVEEEVAAEEDEGLEEEEAAVEEADAAASEAVEEEVAVEEALGEYGAPAGRRGRKSGRARKLTRKSQQKKNKRRKTQAKRTQRKGKKTQRKGRRTQRRLNK